MLHQEVINIVLAGIGGTGVILSSNIVADSAFLAGYDVRKSEIHGMSQRGGSVSSDVRFGKKVYSPMVPDGEADFLLVMHPDELENNLYRLKPNGIVIDISIIVGESRELSLLNDEKYLPVNQKNFNICLLGALSNYLDIPYDCWNKAIFSNLPKKVHEQNKGVFEYGMRLTEEVKQK
ncbi:MAG TPA: indolepyruvate oxidoreductase subunit beta [Candidatus Hydrogenedens sp.]|nr:indolepyruvate oxidoreductase subunit beta [Candidatus Hydrogenedens sp.]HOK08162.1 indolepyruvate oxidoreductase subunit beta [Candidatus Hydrogenedens sp.]HPP58631.1 indolepyruvate oxidoreductase subunit beta [Candidatus Hydrogenedens sp.]